VYTIYTYCNAAAWNNNTGRVDTPDLRCHNPNTLHRENLSRVHQNQLRPKFVYALYRPQLFCSTALGVTFVDNTRLHQKFELPGRPNVRTTETKLTHTFIWCNHCQERVQTSNGKAYLRPPQLTATSDSRTQLWKALLHMFWRKKAISTVLLYRTVNWMYHSGTTKSAYVKLSAFRNRIKSASSKRRLTNTWIENRTNIRHRMVGLWTNLFSHTFNKHVTAWISCTDIYKMNIPTLISYVFGTSLSVAPHLLFG
jgi:hypothetical protein